MFQTGKGQVGLDHYQVCGRTGWYRFITLSMLALAVLTLLAAQQPDSDPDIIALTVAEIRRLLNAEEVEHLRPDERADRRRCTRVYRPIPPALPPATAAESRTQTARDTTRAQLPRLTPPVSPDAAGGPSAEQRYSERLNLASAHRRMASSSLMIRDFAKDYLHRQHRSIRQALIWKLSVDAVRKPDRAEARP